MYLAEFQLYGYKSFLDSGPIKLRPGFNILTGQNNAGKTALLEGLSLQFENKPHRSLATAPTPSSYSEGSSCALFRIGLTQQEFRTALSQIPNAAAVIPIRRTAFPNYEQAWEALSKEQEIQLEAAYVASQGQAHADRLQQPREVFKNHTPDSDYFFLMLQSPPGKDRINPGITNNPYSHVSRHLAQKLMRGIYSFRAERMHIGRSKFGSEEELYPDASNLPEVLHVLQSKNPERFKKYNRFVKRVFPQVEWVSSQPLGREQVEIFIWGVDPATERTDLSVPLLESGTGISQVLAMLYVLVTADMPRTILIDEPNSFLHPGAVRVLIEILREYPQHQYIITTHSPELISASNPATVHMLRRDQGQTVVESVDTQEARHLRSLLMEVGSRFSDVFGAENVLWVEGPTEQLCYPLIVRQLLRRSLAGVSIVGVLHTGDFDAKTDTRSVFRIYDRLTHGGALLPPAIAFIFDRELRPEKKREELRRAGNKKVYFLSRRTYENYLLNAGAIAAVLNANPPFTENPVSPEKVQVWLEAHIADPKYYGKVKPQSYIQDVDAPKLLDDLFSEFSEARLSYNKVEHSLALTEWLLEHDPRELKEIADILIQVLPPVS